MSKHHQCLTIRVYVDGDGWTVRIDNHAGHIEITDRTKEEALANVINSLNQAEQDYLQGIMTELSTSRHVGQA